MGHYRSEMIESQTLHYNVVVAGLTTHKVEVEEYDGEYTVRVPGFCQSARHPDELVKAIAKWHRWDMLFFDRVKTT